MVNVGAPINTFFSQYRLHDWKQYFKMGWLSHRCHNSTFLPLTWTLYIIHGHRQGGLSIVPLGYTMGHPFKTDTGEAWGLRTSLWIILLFAGHKWAKMQTNFLNLTLPWRICLWCSVVLCTQNPIDNHRHTTWFTVELSKNSESLNDIQFT